MKRLIIIIISHFTFNAAICQVNLVPNPSFEEYTTCPLFVGDFTVENWIKPTWGSSDNFHLCSIGQLGIPQNVFGWQYPKTGIAYVGAHGSDGSGSDVREYIQCLLLSQLEEGKQYEVSFWVSRADSSTFACDNIGACLTNTAISGSFNENLPYSPQVVSNYNNPISDAINWVQVIDTITALGGEQYLTIGVFTNDANTNYSAVSGGWQTVFHYYYDDVSIVKITSNSINETESANISVFQNPSSGNIIIDSEKKIENYEIYSLLGQFIMKSTVNNQSTIINLSDNPSGLYFIKLKTKNSIMVKKVTIYH